MTSQVTLFGVLSLVRPATNCCNALVGTVAVPGDRLTRMPESIVTVAVPVFFLLPVAVAVRVIVSPVKLLGNLEGAVNVTVVAVELAGILPVVSLQGDGWDVVVVVPLVVVVVKVHVQVTDVSVAPLTVAVNVWVCVVTSVTEPGDTETVTVLAPLLPPQPAVSKMLTDSIAAATHPKLLRNLIPHASPRVHSYRQIWRPLWSLATPHLNLSKNSAGACGLLLKRPAHGEPERRFRLKVIQAPWIRLQLKKLRLHLELPHVRWQRILE